MDSSISKLKHHIFTFIFIFIFVNYDYS